MVLIFIQIIAFNINIRVYIQTYFEPKFLIYHKLSKKEFTMDNLDDLCLEHVLPGMHSIINDRNLLFLWERM